MSWVKTFRIHPYYGVPDKDVREFINFCEREGVVDVHAVFIPATGTADARLTVIINKVDEPLIITNPEDPVSTMKIYEDNPENSPEEIK